MKKAQLSGYVQFGANLLVTTVLFFLLRKPIINPMIDEAVGSTTDPLTKVFLKFVPFVFLFFLGLILTNILKRG